MIFLGTSISSFSEFRRFGFADVFPARRILLTNLPLSTQIEANTFIPRLKKVKTKQGFIENPPFS